MKQRFPFKRCDLVAVTRDLVIDESRSYDPPIQIASEADPYSTYKVRIPSGSYGIVIDSFISQQFYVEHTKYADRPVYYSVLIDGLQYRCSGDCLRLVRAGNES